MRGIAPAAIIVAALAMLARSESALLWLGVAVLAGIWLAVDAARSELAGIRSALWRAQSKTEPPRDENDHDSVVGPPSNLADLRAMYVQAKYPRTWRDRNVANDNDDDIA